ncbi:hypothetical protein ES707_09308 [subsurface metagenome]
MSYVDKQIDYTGNLLLVPSLFELAIIPSKKLVCSLSGENAIGIRADKPSSQEIGNCSVHTALLIHLLVIDSLR